MADTQTTVALNIGSQRIGMAVFETSKNGTLILKGYETDTIIADPAMDASREAQIRVALDDLVAKLKVPKSKVRYAISGQTVFTRFVKLPPIQGDNIEQLVTFEAQQHVPFPINEVVWDYYELVESGSEKEVVIVAIKSDALDEINDTVSHSGLSTAEVDIAPMALFNAYRNAYGTPDAPTLIIDVGAKSSNLLYLEGKRFFTRSVAIGGASITSAIAKEYNISFPDAEYQKVTNGLVALSGGHTESIDESLAALAMVIRNALTRLPAEISRTTNYYRSQHGGSAPTKVLLAGGGVNLPYTLEFFREKLNLPVEYFNPLSNITIAKGLDTELLQREAHTMGELVGLGLRGIGKSTINIDLVPSAVKLTRAADRRKPFLIASAALLVVGFAVWAVFQNISATKAQDRARTITETSENLAPVASQIRNLLQTQEQLSKISSAYTQLESDHAYWFDLIGELRGAFASDSVWLTEMSPLLAYDPLPPKDGKKAAVSEAVKSSSAKSERTESAIEKPPATEAANPRQARNQKPQETAVTSNAIRIKGFWRENASNQDIVSQLVKKLRENTKSFKFSVQDPAGKQVILSDDQILKVTLTGPEGDLGFPFELTLPLARPVVVR